MKKQLLFVILTLLFQLSYATGCLTQKEKERISKAFDGLNYYKDVPNFISNNQQSILGKFVCKNQEYLDMFHLLSIANVYAWENASKIEVDHSTFNDKRMRSWIDKYNTEIINEVSLCYDLKVETTDLLGGLSPYRIVSVQGEGTTEDYVVQENSHGMVLSNKGGYKIYIGESFDVLDSLRNKGCWYKDNNTYYISIGDNKLTFYFEENE